MRLMFQDVGQTAFTDVRVDVDDRFVAATLVARIDWDVETFLERRVLSLR